MNRRRKINDLETNLGSIEISREDTTTPSWKFGKHTLEFLQKMRVIKYREARELISRSKVYPSVEKKFVDILKRDLSEEVDFVRITHFIGDDPFEYIAIWPMNGIEVIKEKEYQKAVNNKKTEISKAYKKLIDHFEIESKLTAPLNKWFNERFKNGDLENNIEKYLRQIKQKNEKASTHRFSKLILKKLGGKRDRPYEVFPKFDVAEMDVLHVAWHKAQNMTQKEMEILKKLDKGANSPGRPGWHVVISKSEALNMCYTGGSQSTDRRAKFFTALESLTKKYITWFDGEDGLYQIPIVKIAFAYQLLKEELEEGRYFCIEIPVKLLKKLSNDYFKTDRNERLKLRSIPPKMTIAQDRFLLKLKEVAPINKRSIREYKWDAENWANKIWEKNTQNLSRNIDTLEEFGKKQVLLRFLESFKRIEDCGKTFFQFTFPKYDRWH